MWEAIKNRIPSGTVLLCTLLSVLIPYGIYRLNALLHKLGDAPWNKENNKPGGDNQQPSGNKPAKEGT
ncbi:MAG: hypothetical protein K0S39_1479 [Paenibacillus sp.]|nr:hypothetical protein [Paenibacillus sp.]